MVEEVIAELVVAIGQTVTMDDEILNTKSKTKSAIIHVLLYLVPLSLLVGFYFWTVY